MSIKKLFFMSALSICAFLGVLALKKRAKVEVASSHVEQVAQPELAVEKKRATVEPATPHPEVQEKLAPIQDAIASEEVDHIDRFFATGKEQFPIVQTIKYKSRVSWLTGKPAWIADYAAHYKTSRHFIARSLNRTKDYTTQKVGAGDTFTVLHPEKNLHFYLVIDISRCKMWFYYHDLIADERVLVKTYRVGLGRLDLEAESGVLTPLGRYWLGSKVATYKPGVLDYFQGTETEMVRVFGTRWIPFQVKGRRGADAQGYGIHGVPWIYSEDEASYSEDKDVLGKYASDGCVRLAKEDMEELYAIVISRPTCVEIVTDIEEAILPTVSGSDAVRMKKEGE